MTVQGPASPEELGVTITHEHILIDLGCWYMEPSEASQIAFIDEPVRLDNLWWIWKHPFGNKDNLQLSDTDESMEEVMEFKRYGGGTIVDVTNIGLGRDPTALKKISIETGVNVIMGSGYYFAPSHPPDMSEKTLDDIAGEIVKDVTEGVDGTGIKAGIIGEIAITDIEKEPNEEKSLRAGAIAQKKTGAPLTIHPALTMRQCERVIEVLDEEGADLSRTIMSHTDVFLDDGMEYTYMIADAGMYIEYDLWGVEGNWPATGLRFPSDTQRVKGVVKLIKKGYLDRLLLSQDVCTKVQTVKYGGFGRTHILRDCLPLFKINGISEEEIEAMLVENPKRALQFI